MTTVTPSRSTYGTVDQIFAGKSDVLRGDGGNGLLKVIYLTNAFIVVLCGICLLGQGQVRSTVLGGEIVLLGTVAVGLEFMHPPVVMKLLPLYETNLGRGTLFFLLSSCCLYGSYLLGVISLALSVASIALHFLGYDVPLPLFEHSPVEIVVHDDIMTGN